MEIHNILKDKRKSLGLTQEQVANYLGITTPAVNKWERGLSFPDITLLPRLARLLKTDPNTLLCFNENLTTLEISNITNEVNELIKSKGFEDGYNLALEHIKEYPYCSQLKYNLALVLDGALMFSVPSKYPTDDYSIKINKLYEEVTECDNEALVYNARFILASKHLQKNEFSEAQSLLDLIPQRSSLPDKQTLEVNLLSMQDKSEDAAIILERMALTSLQEVLMSVTKLIPILVSENKLLEADKLARAIQLQHETFGLWDYSGYLASMQLAIAKKDIPSSIFIIRKMLDYCVHVWDSSDCPLYLHQPVKKESTSMGHSFLPSMLLELENSPEYAFLQSSSEFLELIEEYKHKL